MHYYRMVCRVWVDEPGLGAVADVELVHAPVPGRFLNFDIDTFCAILIVQAAIKLR